MKWERDVETGIESWLIFTVIVMASFTSFGTKDMTDQYTGKGHPSGNCFRW